MYSSARAVKLDPIEKYHYQLEHSAYVCVFAVSYTEFIIFLGPHLGSLFTLYTEAVCILII